MTVLLRFGDVRVAIHWIDLPGIARYQMEFAVYAPDRRVTLAFGSPYLRNEPCALIVEGGDAGTARSWRSEEIAGYQSGFRRELEVFACLHRGRLRAGHLGPGRAGGHRPVPGDHRLPPRPQAGAQPDGRRLVTGPAQVRIGIVGYGLMGRAHCYGYRVAPMLRRLPVTPVVTVMSGRDAAAVGAAAAAYGVPAHVTSWQTLVERDDVDIVDICTPPGTHAEIAMAAAAAGKAVLCEKPLAATYAQARAAAQAVTEAGVRNAVGFNYRRLPAVALMRRMIADGAVGEPRLWRASFLSDEFTDPATPFDWRFDRAMGGTTIADLGSHLIDLALWMVGEISAVCAQSQTFIGQRALPGGGTAAVTVDDASSALLTFVIRGARRGRDGARRGPAARVTSPWRSTAAPAPWCSTTPGSTSSGSAPRTTIRRRTGCGGSGPSIPAIPMPRTGGRSGRGSATAPLSRTRPPTCWRAGRAAEWTPDFGQGARVQAVCEAMERSAAGGRWVPVAEVAPDDPGPAAPVSSRGVRLARRPASSASG